MGGPSNHRIVDNAEDWMRQQEKRLLHEERRPRIGRASDLLGPGIAPTAVEIRSWSGTETEFNGFFYSAPSATANAPDTTRWWIGHSITQVEGYGIQEVWDYRGTSTPPTRFIRRFARTGGTRTFSAWA